MYGVNNERRFFPNIRLSPYLYKTTQEKEYVNFLWDAFYVNYEKEKYQFAFIVYHASL